MSARHDFQYPSVQGPVRTIAAVVPAWFQNDTRQVWPRRWAQQPPSYCAPVTDPSRFPAPTWFEIRQEQKWPRRWAQQPIYGIPAADPSLFPPPIWFQDDTRQVRPRRWAQQPNSYAGIVLDPSLFLVQASFIDSELPQRFPRHWAQQPTSLSGPVMVISAVVSRRRHAQII